MQAFSNGGLYFTRTDLAQTGSSGEGGWLYYLSADELGSGWNSVTGNGADYLDVVAQTTDHVDTAAIFYLDEAGAHHYLYVDGDNIFRADVTEEGTETTLIARGATDATLISIDDTSSDEYSYVYYTIAGDSGSNIYRGVYNGTEEDYRILGYEDNAPFAPVQLLDIEHAGSWYNFEILDGTVFFADAETIGTTSYNYISTLSLKNGNGALMDNAELKALNEEYDEIVGEDGIIESSADDVGENMPTALRYYFFMGRTTSSTPLPRSIPTTSTSLRTDTLPMIRRRSCATSGKRSTKARRTPTFTAPRSRSTSRALWKTATASARRARGATSSPASAR